MISSNTYNVTSDKLAFKNLYKAAMNSVKGTGKRFSQAFVLSVIGGINSVDALVINTINYGFENLPNRLA